MARCVLYGCTRRCAASAFFRFLVAPGSFATDMALVLQGSTFPGLLNLVYMYLETLDVEVESRQHIEEYLALVRCRTDGT